MERVTEGKEQLQPQQGKTLATYVNIDVFELPEKANQNELVMGRATAVTTTTLPSGNYASILWGYLDGPTDSVTVVANGVEETLPKGVGVRYSVGPNPPAGTKVGVGFWFKLSQVGKYTFRAETYYGTPGSWTFDTGLNKTIEILAPAAPKAEGGLTESISKLMETILPLMMTMMMLMMMMSLMTSLMRTFKPGGGQ